MHRTIHIATILLVTFGVPAGAQTPAEELRKMNQAYADQQRLVMDMEYRLYETHEATEAVHVEKGTIIKEGEKRIQKIGPLETFHRPDYTLSVDHDDQVIMLLPPVQESVDASFRKGWIENMDTIFTLCKESYVEQVNDRQRKIVMVMPNQDPQEKVEVIYSTSDYFILQVTFYYRRPQQLFEDKEKEFPPRLEVFYKKITNTDLAAERYIEKDRYGYRPASAYRNYSFHNQLIPE